ncbi:hypothetical protein HPB51_025543 [Rhipicephalus microplus]|uniref:Uncharacterized protein n=1 Tax=Rhipicephalus microplus TaxID=6941 RepID=A0A9J6F955_RHIMP|nr:hypothetical protein HPB51_025543 [Rhipicephalus microplus]
MTINWSSKQPGPNVKGSTSASDTWPDLGQVKSTPVSSVLIGCQSGASNTNYTRTRMPDKACNAHSKASVFSGAVTVGAKLRAATWHDLLPKSVKAGSSRRPFSGGTTTASMDNEAASEAKRPRLEDGDSSPAAVDDAKRGFRVQATGSAGTLLFSGGTNWDTIGRRPKDKQKAGGSQERNLWGPHRLAWPHRVKAVFSGCSACHTVLLTEQGQAYTWGNYST